MRQIRSRWRITLCHVPHCWVEVYSYLLIQPERFNQTKVKAHCHAPGFYVPFTYILLVSAFRGSKLSENLIPSPHYFFWFCLFSFSCECVPSDYIFLTFSSFLVPNIINLGTLFSDTSLSLLELNVKQVSMLWGRWTHPSLCIT